MVAMQSEVSVLPWFPHLVMASAFLDPTFIREENGTRSHESASQAFRCRCGRLRTLASHPQGKVQPHQVRLGWEPTGK